MHSIMTILAFAATAHHYAVALPQTFPVAPGGGEEEVTSVICGAEDFKDATVSDCRIAIDSIDPSIEDITNPMREDNEVVTQDPLLQNVVVAKYGRCKIAGVVKISFGGGPPIPTTLSGAELITFANAILDGCNNGANLANGVANGGDNRVAIAAGW